MIKKNLRNLLFLVGLVLVVGGTPSADSFELNGPGTVTFEDELEGDEVVLPGGVITVTISNNRPGYQRFFIYLEGDDEEGNEVLLWGTFVGGDNCRPGSSCVFDVPNIPQLGIPAEYLGVTGFFGGNGARATVDHVTSNP
jgi:hypothetical protein